MEKSMMNLILPLLSKRVMNEITFQAAKYANLQDWTEKAYGRVQEIPVSVEKGVKSDSGSPSYALSATFYKI